MKGNFPYSFFPSKPKDEAGSSAPARPASNGNDAQVVALLIEAVSVLKDIRQILANPGRVHVIEDELSPDSEVPFET